jgi:hypothetical protein
MIWRRKQVPVLFQITKNKTADIRILCELRR